MNEGASSREVASRAAERNRWDRLHRFERDEAAAALAALTQQEGYAQFLSAYLLFGVRVPDDMGPLAEADFRDRVALVAKRQRAFAGLAGGASARKWPAQP
ncbi:MAG: hypothetical protein M0R80_24605 [Proteobacteria bacterium]|jgi:hypothetical protein|nr:hypothetical protein [Pseudomonadota bacterium]